MRLNESPQKDRFAHDRLPPDIHWPEILPINPDTLPAQINCCSILLDKNIDSGNGARIAIYGFENGRERSWSYQQLNDRVCRIANVLVESHGVVPGNRVLIYAPNSPEVAAIWLAVQKIGAIAVTTLALLRAGELCKLIDKSQPAVALCHVEGCNELGNAISSSNTDCRMVDFKADGGALYRQMQGVKNTCATCPHPWRRPFQS